MQRSRFVFLAAPVPQPQEELGAVPSILWMLVSPNNRPLGRAARQYPAYATCRQAVLDLQAGHDRLVAFEATDDSTGQWTWRADLDGVCVAVSSRSYLRARECAYNLERFLEAVPQAEVVAGTRSARRGREHAGRQIELPDGRSRTAVPQPGPARTTARSVDQSYRLSLRTRGDGAGR